MTEAPQTNKISLLNWGRNGSFWLCIVSVFHLKPWLLLGYLHPVYLYDGYSCLYKLVASTSLAVQQTLFCFPDKMFSPHRKCDIFNYFPSRQKCTHLTLYPMLVGDFPESSNHLANETEVNSLFSLCSGECIGMLSRDSWSRHLVFLCFGADCFYTIQKPRRRGALAKLLTPSQKLFTLYLPRHRQLPVYLPPTW